MKMNKLAFAALAAMAMSLAGTGAFAASPSGNANDMYFGMQDLAGDAADNSGNNNPLNLVYDLGSFSNFTNTYNATFTQLTPTILNTTFPSPATWSDNQAADDGINWSVAGIANAGQGGASIVLDDTNKSSTQSLPSSLSVANGNIGNMFNGFNVSALVAGTTAVGTETNPEGSVAPNTYAALDSGSNSGYGQFSGETLMGVGSLYLWQYSNVTGKATELGVFTLASDGTLTYNGVGAVPEPSAYALGACAVLLFLVLRRRQSVA